MEKKSIMKFNRILRKIVAVHGLRNREAAFVYLNGEIILAHTHPHAIFKYLSEHDLLRKFASDFYYNTLKDKFPKEKIDKIIAKKMRDMEKTHFFDHNLREAIWEYGARNLSFTKLPIALGHYLKNFTGKEELFLIMPSVTNVSLSEVINALHNKYPTAVIKDDDTNEVLFQPAEAKHVTREGYYFQCYLQHYNREGLGSRSVLDSIYNSPINTNIHYELSHITDYDKIKIIYECISETETVVYIHLSEITNESMKAKTDEEIADIVFFAICDAVNGTNGQFEILGIDNYFELPQKYRIQYHPGYKLDGYEI